MKCQLCRISTDFGKSHVIPGSFLLSEGSADETPFIVSSSDRHFPKRRPIGEYDSEILCKTCERKFGQWDDYAKVLLLDGFQEFKSFREGDDIIGYQIDSFDYEKLRLFFVSLLWRASVSKRVFFQHVSLGPHEEVIREMILDAKPGTSDEYSVQLYRFKGVEYGIPILMPVHIRTTYGYRYNRVYLGSYFFDIKLSRRATPSAHRIGEIERDIPIIIACKNIKEMDEYRILQMVARAPHNARAVIQGVSNG